MFRLLDNTNNKENIIRIQGKQTTRSAPISTLMFQNFDADTKRLIDLIAVSCYDSDNNESNNSFGDFVIRTRDASSCNLMERLRVGYNGVVQIGQDASSNSYSNALLNIGGDLYVQSNISANDISVGILRAQTIFTTQTINSVQNINTQASDSQTIETLYTKRLVISRAGPNSSNNSDSIYYFKDWSSYDPSISNDSMSSVLLQRAEHRILNKSIDIDIAFSFHLSDSNLSNLSFLTPVGESKDTIKSQYSIYNISNATFSMNNLMTISSSNINLLFNNLSNSDYEISILASYKLP
jgi:hypothetical protein